MNDLVKSKHKLISELCELRVQNSKLKHQVDTAYNQALRDAAEIAESQAMNISTMVLAQSIAQAIRNEINE